jgi:hypothetical protein
MRGDDAAPGDVDIQQQDIRLRLRGDAGGVRRGGAFGDYLYIADASEGTPEPFKEQRMIVNSRDPN